MRTMIRNTIVACTIGFASVAARAEGDATPSVAYLNTITNVIVVGTGTVQNTGPQTAVLTIQVTRVVKQIDAPGPAVPSTITVNLASSNPACDLSTNQNPVSALWFLVEYTDGSFDLSPSPKAENCHPMASGFDVPPGPLSPGFVYPSTLSNADKLGFEFAQTIVAHHAMGPGAFISGAGNLLTGISKQAANTIYSRMASSVDIPVQTLGQVGLLKLADPTTLTNLATSPNSFLQFPTAPGIPGTGGKPVLTGTYSITSFEALAEMNISSIVDTQASTVQALGSLLNQTQNLGMQQAAARALRNIHTLDAVTLLAPYLSSNQTNLRDEAIAAVGLYANGAPPIDYTNGQGLDLNQPGPLRTNDTLAHFAMGSDTIDPNAQYYMDYRQNWWSQHSSVQ